VIAMTIFDYLLNTALVALVVLQMRGRRLDRRGLLLPLGLVAWAASHYLRGIPTAGNDLVLVVVGVLAGLTLGAASAALTRLDVDHDGVPVARATLAAAALWVVGIGARMGCRPRGDRPDRLIRRDADLGRRVRPEGLGEIGEHRHACGPRGGRRSCHPPAAPARVPADPSWSDGTGGGSERIGGDSFDAGHAKRPAARRPPERWRAVAIRTLRSPAG
jgi:hypothetical protein